MHQPGRTVLAVVGRYHYITARQVTRLLGWQTFAPYANLWLKNLTEDRYLVCANWIEKGPTAGGPEMVWSLTQRGRTALQALDIIVSPRIHQSPERAQLFMHHTQAVGDVLIACERYANQTAGVEMLELFHDQDLQRRAVKVQVPGFEKPTNVAQDGLTVFKIGDVAFPIGWEVDRATEHRDKWQAKVAALIEFGRGPYQQAFHNESLRVAVYVRSGMRSVSSEQRARQLVDWTQDALEGANKRQWGEFFAITCVDPVTVEPEYFLRGPHWVSPFERAYKPLLPEVMP